MSLKFYDNIVYIVLGLSLEYEVEDEFKSLVLQR